MRATDLAHQIVSKVVKPGDHVVDATIGNGHDTLFLANLVGPSGHVYGFDIQDAALVETATRIKDVTHVTLHRCGHEHLGEHLPTPARKNLAAVMFNLGYLPGADKGITTHASSTLQAIEQAMADVKQGGVITVVLYPGHDGGNREATAVREFIASLSPNFETTIHPAPRTLNPAPELVSVERKL